MYVIVKLVFQAITSYFYQRYVFSIEFYTSYEYYSNILCVSVCIYLLFFSLFLFIQYTNHALVLMMMMSEMRVLSRGMSSDKKRNWKWRLVRGKGTSEESSRHSRYAVSGLLCPNFCAHLSAHPFANPGIPRPGRPTLLPASLVTGFHF